MNSGWPRPSYQTLPHRPLSEVCGWGLSIASTCSAAESSPLTRAMLLMGEMAIRLIGPSPTWICFRLTLDVA
jgi:hypothetical protein